MDRFKACTVEALRYGTLVITVKCPDITKVYLKDVQSLLIGMTKGALSIVY